MPRPGRTRQNFSKITKAGRVAPRFPAMSSRSSRARTGRVTHLSALMPSLFAKHPAPEDLVTLPGVGHETANVEFGNSFGRLR